MKILVLGVLVSGLPAAVEKPVAGSEPAQSLIQRHGVARHRNPNAARNTKISAYAVLKFDCPRLSLASPTAPIRQRQSSVEICVAIRRRQLLRMLHRMATVKWRAGRTACIILIITTGNLSAYGRGHPMARASGTAAALFIAILCVTTFGNVNAQPESQGAERNNPRSEAHYSWCMKTAHYLQTGYNKCKTDRCRNLVTKVFGLWQTRCFRR